ncbi:uncharacterized protein LOC110825955 [Carica papaya]|uniref:uncharacterized protein LOC110825955 n=1 Tax=Carica papaya TaxID=3649 RepID=UPI000B8C8D2F|nr:uncharacterized protein LOC110825955 [Carica papaya]
MESLKRYWRRRKYQRLHGSTKKKLKLARLGAGARRLWRMRRIPKLKLASPIKVLAKFHDAYIDMMIRLVTNLGKANQNGSFRGNKVAKERDLTVSYCGDEVVDSRLVLEIYKRLAANRELGTS